MELKAFIKSEFIDIKKNYDNSSSTFYFQRLVGNMEAEIVFLGDAIKN